MNIFKICFQNTFSDPIINILYSYHAKHIDLLTDSSDTILCRQYYNDKNEVVERIWYPYQKYIKSISVHDVNNRTIPTINDMKDLNTIVMWFLSENATRTQMVLSMSTNPPNQLNHFLELLYNSLIPKTWSDNMKTKMDITHFIINTYDSMLGRPSNINNLLTVWLKWIKPENEQNLQDDYTARLKRIL